MATAFKQVADNAISTTNTNLSATGVTALAVANNEGSKFPTPGNGFYLVLWNGAKPGDDPNMEKVLVTARSTNNLTHAATTKTHTSPCNIGLLDGSGAIVELQNAVNALESVAPGGGGAGGSTADPVTIVASSGASRTLTLPANGLATFDLTLTANCALTLAGATAGLACTITVVVRQDATGGRTLSYPNTVIWAGGAPRFLSTAASSVDIIAFVTTDGGASWVGY